MKAKQNKYNALKTAMGLSRKAEIDQYGKQVSLRPSVAHRSKKQYTRKTKHKKGLL